MGNILVVEDEPRVRDGLVLALEAKGHRAATAGTVAEARAALRRQAFECVLLDVRLPDASGLDLLVEIQGGLAPGTPVIMATAAGDSGQTIAAIKAGAFDYLTKPFDLRALIATVERALRSRAPGAPAAAPPASPPTAAETLVGASASMLSVWKAIGRVAGSDAPVLILGETGTGKELVARAIHAHSARAAGPFVAVNLASLSPSLIESELVGHEQGAFTGATRRRIGRIELAGAGTLFLDEIGDVDPSLQTKLLRVLQDGTFERVGGNETLTSRARIVAATNRPVRPSEPAPALREDLYYRLAVVEIEIPPLRARRSDIPLLVSHALGRTRARAVTEEAMERLFAHSWPGNVRELFHVIERAAVMCGGEVLDVGDLPPSLGPAPRSLPGDLEAAESLPLREAVAAFEKRLIERALERSGGNRAEAARILGIARPQLYTKMDEHGITTGDRGRRGSAGPPGDPR